MAYKKRLMDYLNRFIGDLLSRSDGIKQRIEALQPHIEPLLWQAAQREARDSVPGDASAASAATDNALPAWRERWCGLRRWFVGHAHETPQSELLRSKALAAIVQMLTAIDMLNERRSGRSDRAADFQVLACWFAECSDDGQAHRLARAAFALNPARHFSLAGTVADDSPEVPASTPWAAAPPVYIHPRLRQYGEAAPRAGMPRIQVRDDERRLLAAQLQEEHAQIEAARQQLASGQPVRLSALGRLEPHAFTLFLSLLGEALTAQNSPEESVELQSGDGLLRIRLQPLEANRRAQIWTAKGIFAGRDHEITITELQP